MRFEYLIYPRAREILDKSGLTDRIKEARKDNKISILGHISNRDVIDWVTELKGGGWFDELPTEERKSFSEPLNKTFKKKSEAHWNIKRFDGEYKEPVEIEDFLLLTGCRASQILEKRELFNYKEFGFSGVSEMVGTVGAAMNSAVKDDYYGKGGLKWQTQRPDGIILANEITGDTNCDLRIFQNDITPYETLDPVGNKVHYRPQTMADSGIVAAYHSTEGTLFTAILKWVDQLGITPDSLKDNGRELISWTRSLGQGGGTCTEHFGGFDNDARKFFIGWGYSLPQLDESSSTSELPNFSLFSQSEGAYGIYLGKNQEFSIAYDSFANRLFANRLLDPKKNISVSFLPSESDKVIRGLLYQCAKGLGRTSAKQLIDILEYRFSTELKRDLERYKI